MAAITINGVLRQITGVEGSELDINRILFYKKDGKEYAMLFKDDVIVEATNAVKGTDNVDYNDCIDVSLYADGLAHQKNSSGYFNEGSIGGIYADDLNGSTFTTSNHPNYTTA